MTNTDRLSFSSEHSSCKVDINNRNYLYFYDCVQSIVCMKNDMNGQKCCRRHITISLSDGRYLFDEMEEFFTSELLDNKLRLKNSSEMKSLNDIMCICISLHPCLFIILVRNIIHIHGEI